ncbi:MAG: serine/threonine-protein kinase [Byssovorax sp.]
MSLLGRLKSWMGGEGPARPERESAPAPKVEPREAPAGGTEERGALPQIQRLARVGVEGGPTVDEAIALLRQVRGTVHESSAVSHALRELSLRVIPEPVRVACADILAARGDEPGALRVLEGVSSTAGLVLAADLYAAAGQLPRAASTIERVLARDLSAPGARERHQRFRQALGYDRREVRRLDEATVVAQKAPKGPFNLLREVARGGAGAVYEAEDQVLGRRVAFKVYHARSADRPQLEREARMLAKLAGPGVLRIFDADPAEGWLALEWVARGSVRDLLRAGVIEPLVPVGRWARPLARAVARIHAAGLVHADIKPANVLVRAPNDPVLGDFGSARRAGAPSDGGSAGYVSPERLAGRASDPRDDVYGFGRVLEDVLHRLAEVGGAGGAGEDTAAFQALALACVGPDEARPADGGALVRALP